MPGTPSMSTTPEYRVRDAAEREARATRCAPRIVSGFPPEATASPYSTTSGSRMASSAVRSPPRAAARNASASARCRASSDAPDAAAPDAAAPDVDPAPDAGAPDTDSDPDTD